MYLTLFFYATNLLCFCLGAYPLKTGFIPKAFKQMFNTDFKNSKPAWL